MTRSKFVVIHHKAKRAGDHRDLRFKMPGSSNWASFAIRKDIPTKTGQKVLAVRTHDHTTKEALFTGKIESGYGAGTLKKWDGGSCIIGKYSSAHMKIEFKGSKLKGVYHLVNLGVMNRKYDKNQYMFFKGKESSIVESYLLEIQQDIRRVQYLRVLDRYVPRNKTIVFGSGTLVLYGLKDKNKDLDVAVTQDVFDKLKPTGNLIHAVGKVSKQPSYATRDDLLEIFPAPWPLPKNTEYYLNRAIKVNGYNFLNLEDTLNWKLRMGRPKDLADARAIQTYMRKQK